MIPPCLLGSALHPLFNTLPPTNPLLFVPEPEPHVEVYCYVELPVQSEPAPTTHEDVYPIQVSVVPPTPRANVLEVVLAVMEMEGDAP